MRDDYLDLTIYLSGFNHEQRFETFLKRSYGNSCDAQYFSQFSFQLMLLLRNSSIELTHRECKIHIFLLSIIDQRLQN